MKHEILYMIAKWDEKTRKDGIYSKWLDKEIRLKLDKCGDFSMLHVSKDTYDDSTRIQYSIKHAEQELRQKMWKLFSQPRSYYGWQSLPENGVNVVIWGDSNFETNSIFDIFDRPSLYFLIEHSAVCSEENFHPLRSETSYQQRWTVRASLFGCWSCLDCSLV